MELVQYYLSILYNNLWILVDDCLNIQYLFDRNLEIKGSLDWT